VAALAEQVDEVNAEAAMTRRHRLWHASVWRVLAPLLALAMVAAIWSTS
jgi:hypothetical protein